MDAAKNHAQLILTVVFLVVSISLFEPVMSWILVLVVCAVVMRTALYLQLQKHAPSLRTLNLLALLSAIVLAYFSFQLGVLLGMLNLLVLACSLKLMLLRTNKDYYQLITSCGFLIGCGFIFQQGIGFSLFYLLLTLLLILSLASHNSPGLSLSSSAKRIGTMGLQALPIAALLFLVIPQIGPLWQMPTSKSHQTGLSEEVTPGDIANLSQSADLAFRVTFDNDVPPPSERYWRALVMEEFDGKAWRVAAERKAVRRQYRRYNREFSPQLDGPYVSYEVTLEPTHQRWLFSLDVAVPDGTVSSRDIWQGHEYQLTLNNPAVSSVQYRLRSYLQAPLNQALFSVDNRINKQLPQQGNPRTQAWANQLRQQYPVDVDYVLAVMNYFRQPEFEYTLKPPLMQRNPVDTFLFDEQKGFCSHYASAMAYVLRLGGIPARLVTGYQGGEMREEDYLSVYQFDAHAWIEAWYDESGWQRFDPTAVVAPDRVEYGLRAAIEEASSLIDSPFSLSRYSAIAWLNEFRFLLADLDFMWTNWVLGFDKETQKDLIKSLIGKLTPQKLALFGLSVMGFIACLLLIFFWPALRKQKVDKVTKYYLKAVQRVERLRIKRTPSQGATHFAAIVSQKLPTSISDPFNQITQTYVQWQYQPSQTRNQSACIDSMKTQWKKLKKGINNVSGKS